MKELLSLTGGYKRHIDYLLTLQSEVLGVQNALFKNLGHDLVLSGCEVTNNGNGTVNIASGVVYVGGEICRFASVANIPSDGTKALVKGAPVTTDPKEFQDGSTKNIYKETFAIIGNTTNQATQVVVRTALYGVKDYISDIVQSYGQKGETKWVIDLDGQFLTNFDAAGAGINPKWLGWHLMNGNGGAPNMSGRGPIGVGSFMDAYGLQHTYTNNQEGGQPRHKLTIAEIPSHDHDFVFDQSGDGDKNLPGANQAYMAGIYKNSGGSKSKKTNKTGGDQAHNIMSPYKAGYWVIKMT